MSDGKKKLSFLTVISTIICVVFVCEAAAPAAAIGNQQFFWWIFLILTFLLPYGMVVAELGTTYDGEGGIYDWVRDGLGDKWGARISYYYWVFSITSRLYSAPPPRVIEASFDISM